jgi:hypothetical protein
MCDEKSFTLAWTEHMKVNVTRGFTLVLLVPPEFQLITTTRKLTLLWSAKLELLNSYLEIGNMATTKQTCRPLGSEEDGSTDHDNLQDRHPQKKEVAKYIDHRSFHRNINLWASFNVFIVAGQLYLSCKRTDSLRRRVLHRAGYKIST